MSQSSRQPAIVLADVHVAYPKADGDVLAGVSAQIEAGQLCALLGPNGSGKSTLIRAVAGLLPVRAGNVTVKGCELSAMTRRERAQTIGLVPQRAEMAFGFSVREVVAMGRAPHQGALMRENKTDHAAIDEALEACSLTQLQRRPLAELSGGEQQRVHVARAFAQRAEVLLLDEAAAHLDVRHREDLFHLVREQIRGRGLTCLAAMHDFNAALRHADAALVLDGGRVAGAGPADEILQPALLSGVFGVKVVRGTLVEGPSVLAVAGNNDGSRSRQSVPDSPIDL